MASSMADRCKLLAGMPTFSTNTIIVGLVGNVTQFAEDGRRLQLDTIFSTAIVKSLTAKKIITIGYINTSAGVSVVSNTLIMKVKLHFSG
jgi:hypothetical protein